MSTKHDAQATPGPTYHNTGPSLSIHDDFGLAQQRFWAEWTDAGRLWMSWWMNSLPLVGWPPIGTVLPPVPGAPLKVDGPGKTAAELSAPQHAEAPVKRVRASSARHH